MINIETIQKLAEKYHQQVVELRRVFHQNPELSFQEKETAKIIEEQLSNLGITCKTGIANNGIIADILGKKVVGKMIALRADIDALPILEKNTFYFKSVNDKVMHACGHDAHTACLIGTARILNELKDEWNGHVRLIFQPAEEKLPGGALQMLNEGIFEDKNPDYVIAQHVDPTIESGKMGIKSGVYMASTDEIYVTLTGKGGHAAMPDKISDTVLAASQIIVSLQQVVSRNIPPEIPAVLSFGRLIADGATNVIPDEVKIEGTFRTFNENQRANAHKRIMDIIEKTAEIYKTDCEVNIVKGYPFLVNNQALAEDIRNNMIDYAGINHVEDLDIRMTSEDFSYFSQKYPAVLYRLGTENANNGTNFPLHSDHFNIDEDAMKTGVGFMVYNTLKLLGAL